MKTLKDKMRELLLRECTGMMGDADRTSRALPFIGGPPDTMIIRFGESSYDATRRKWIIQEDSLEVYAYSHGEYVSVPKTRKASFKKKGEFFEEASADAGYDANGTAFMDITFGPLYGGGYELKVVEEEEACRIIQGRQTSVS